MDPAHAAGPAQTCGEQQRTGCMLQLFHDSPSQGQAVDCCAETRHLLCRAVQVIGATTLLGDLVSSNQRAVFLFYDEWTTPAGYTIGGKVRLCGSPRCRLPYRASLGFRV